MRKLILIISIVTVSIISCKQEKQDTKEIKQEKTKKTIAKNKKNVIVWKGYKPTGSHVGTINVKTVDFKFDREKLIEGKVVFDMNSIKNNDIKDADDNADLVNHLKSTDFFDVNTNPTAIFEITKTIYESNNNLQIVGNLTLNGITKKIIFPATIKINDDSKTLKSEIIKIDRTDFGIKYKSKKFFNNLKDRFINDEFEIAFKLVL